MSSLALEQALQRQYGVVAERIGRQQLDMAIAQAAQARRMAVADWLPLAVVDPAELQALLQILPIGESWLQRDREQFVQIGQWLSQRDRTRPLRVLCAPCAGGEEAWTLAALLHEHGWHRPLAMIHALDINVESLRRAHAGRYRSSAWRGGAALPWWLQQCAADTLQVAPVLAPLVRFERANLLAWGGLECAPYDLLLSRNFLIYLADDARQRWLDRLLQLGSADCRWFSARSEPLALWDNRFESAAEGGFRRGQAGVSQPGLPATGTDPGRVVADTSSRSRPRNRHLPRQTDQLRWTAASPAAAGEPAAAGAASATSLLAAAVLALQQEQLNEAEHLLRGALFLDRNCEQALLHLAALCARSARHDEAERLRARARRLTVLSA